MDHSNVLARKKMGKSSWLDFGDLPDELITDDNTFSELWDEHPDTHGKVVIYGKEIPIPRWQQSYLRDYVFSGAVSKGKDLPDVLHPYLDWCNSLYPGVEFNEVLVNWYEDGSHYIGSHADDEKQLVPGSPIVTITLCLPGTLRKFRIRSKKDKEIVEDIETYNGLVLVMGGKFQSEFKHEVVKMTGGAAKKAGARISITFRQFRK